MIVPSIDLSGGKAVQLRQGRELVLEDDRPVELAKAFTRFGETAVIDLDAALGHGDNEALIEEICRVAECRVGGGIRSIDKAVRIVSGGARRVIVGTMAFTENGVNRRFLEKLSEAIGKRRIIVAVDSLGDEIVTEGWRRNTGLNVMRVLEEIEPYASELLFTCVEQEGLMEGPDMQAIMRVREATNLPVTAAGGVSSTADVEALSKSGLNIQLGMAVYTGALSLPDAFIASLNWKSGLLPTITVDTAFQVLMLAYSSRQSLANAFKTGMGCYYSRSRGQLWVKGETSGNTQHLVRVRADCDRDALLMVVRQDGNACHTGSYSCFGDRRFSLNELYSVARERIMNPREGSYTASLTDQVLKDKIMEEALELAEAGTGRETIWEAADLLYFVTVKLAKSGVSIEAVMDELGRRRRDPRPLAARRRS